ncbi:penicillin-binding protein 1A [Dissulfuribacter thermophilus]|nr:PBP1A family penicillin-binding protein [Dissulfuribacter thermophilus]
MSYLRKKTRRKSRSSSQRILGPRFLIFSLWFWAVFITLGIGCAYLGYMLLDLPEISSINSYRPKQVTEVLDRNGVPLAYWYEERRWVVPLSVMPEFLKDAFLAAEDARFYEHPGIDFLGIIRAFIKNIEAGTIIQGASTITQQVTRALLLSPERSWSRKIKEAILAWKIDHVLTKDEILEIYLNHIYLGEGAYGVEAASRTYFNKNVWDLTLSEAALLAGLTQAPSKYNPLKHFDRAKRRQLYVLRRMAEEGFITEEEMRDAIDEPIRFQKFKLDTPKGIEYFLQDLRKDLVRRYGEEELYTRGFIIKTTLDASLQERAYSEVQKGIKKLLSRHPEDKSLKKHVRAALLAMRAETGEVLAMVGGLDFSKNKFNLATQALIQPGSAFKPVVYSAAMERGLILPNTLLVDEPISLPGLDPENPWEPENFDQTYMGPITIRTALEHSRNVIAVKVARLVGVDAIRELAKKMGILSPIPRNLSIALGSQGVKLSELVQAYSTFPNLGKSVRPQLLLSIEDRSGNVLESFTPVKKQALSKVTSYEMLHLLEGVVQHGTGRRARALGVPVGGKTGTTNDYRDALFIGFTRDVVCGVWLGRDDRKSLGRLETGGRAACPVWTSFMKWTIDKSSEQMEFDVPQGIVVVPVNKRTGEIVTSLRDLNQKKNIVWEALPQSAVPEIKSSRFFRDFNLFFWQR